MSTSIHEMTACQLYGHEIHIEREPEVYDTCLSCGEPATWDDRCPNGEHVFCISNDSFEYDRCFTCGCDRREAYALEDGFISHVAGSGVKW